MQTYIHTYIHTYIPTDTQTHRHTDRHTITRTHHRPHLTINLYHLVKGWESLSPAPALAALDCGERTITNQGHVLKIKIGKEYKFKNLIIKSLKCKNSEFDDNPEITAYIQVRDLTNKNNDEVFVFNGWMFSSSPSIAPFDHPVYDIWLVNCY